MAHPPLCNARVPRVLCPTVCLPPLLVQMLHSHVPVPASAVLQLILVVGTGCPRPFYFWEVSPTPLPNSLREVPSAAVHALENRTRLQVPRLLPASYPALVR